MPEQAGRNRANEPEVAEREEHGLAEPAAGQEGPHQRVLLLRVKHVGACPARLGHESAGEEQVEERIDVVVERREPRARTEAAPEREAHHRHAVDLLASRATVVRRDHGHLVAASGEGASEELQAPGRAAWSPRVIVLGGEDDVHFAAQTAKNPAFSSGYLRASRRRASVSLR